MSITAKVNGAALLAELRFVAPLTEKRSTIPILRALLLEFTPSLLTITGTNLDVVARSSCDIEASGGARIAAPAELLTIALANLIGDDAEAIVSLRVSEIAESPSLDLSYDSCTMTLDCMSADDYPTLPDLPAMRESLPRVALDEALRRVKFAISHEETRFQLMGALLAVGSGLAECVATDGHRLAIASFEARGNSTFKTLIPRAAVDAMLFLDGAVVTYGKDGNHNHLIGDRRRIAARNLDVNFPNYREVIATDLDKKVVVDAETMTLALKRVMSFAEPRVNAASLTFGSGSLTLKVTNFEFGSAETTIDIDRAVSPVTIGFNARYLRDFFARLSGDVEISFRDGKAQSIFRPVGDDSYTYVLMPMRLA